MKKSEVLQEEIDWFETALNNSKDKPYYKEYKKGVETAIEWLKVHRSIAKSEEEKKETAIISEPDTQTFDPHAQHEASMDTKEGSYGTQTAPTGRPPGAP